MAVLGNYEKENAKIILEAIIHKLRRVCKSDSDLKKFIKQLIIISRMRNLEQLTVKISNEMPILIDIEKDYLYNLGLQKHEDLLLEAKEALKKMTIEFTAKAKAEKAAKIIAKKAAREKAEAIAKAKAEAEKVAREKAEAIAKAKKAKQTIIIKMKRANLEDAVIMDFLDLDKAVFDSLVSEIE